MAATNVIRPMSEQQGVGFFAMTPVDVAPGYRYEQKGRYHNYHFTQDNWFWPEAVKANNRHDASFNMDAFSPNLNKRLHIGHLRQLVLATAYRRLLPNVRFVALLGKSIGYLPGAMSRLQGWFDFLAYHPAITMDDMMAEVDKQEDLIPKVDGEGEYTGCKVWVGPTGPVVVRRSDGTATYALHDLVFANKVEPRYYVTGEEQKGHFASLGLADKHLSMGLVLDAATGKKMKSRDGTAMDADDAMAMVQSKLSETPDPKKLAWNVLAWNFLHVSRTQNVTFDPAKWTHPDSPGMYITYTYARVASALKKAIIETAHRDEFTEGDIALLGMTSYLPYWLNRSYETMNFAGLANYVHDLARRLVNAYHAESIKDGRVGFKAAVFTAFTCLGQTMNHLGMFPLEQV